MIALATFTLLGIAIGQPALPLRSKLGDPLLVEQITPVSRTADYLRADDPSAVLKVTERDGVVFAVEIARERREGTLGATDAHAVALGMTRAQVAAKRGVPAFSVADTDLYYEDAGQDASTEYRFDGDVLEAIKLLGSGTSAAGNASLPHIADPSGLDYADAILDVWDNVLVSDHFREQYLTVHDCRSTERSSTIDHRDGRTYAIATAICAGKKHDVYFDITHARP